MIDWESNVNVHLYEVLVKIVKILRYVLNVIYDIIEVSKKVVPYPIW